MQNAENSAGSTFFTVHLSFRVPLIITLLPGLPLRGGAQERFKELTELAAAPEVLGMPLHPHAEGCAGAFDSFDDAVRGGGRHHEPGRDRFHRLMVAAVDAAR